MGCKACERRRKALAEKRRQKQEQGKPVQAAALGAVLAVSEAAGKALGINGEMEDGDEQDSGGSGDPGSGGAQ